jgi:hypothetical protein
MHKTTVYDPTAGFPAPAREHLRECARESGEDYCEYHSCERTDTLPDGRIVESWYDEGPGSAFAWRAFIHGVGTRSGESREAAIANVSV